MTIASKRSHKVPCDVLCCRSPPSLGGRQGNTREPPSPVCVLFALAVELGGAPYYSVLKYHSESVPPAVIDSLVGPLAFRSLR